MDQDYQSDHLKFVSDNHGTDPVEIMLVGVPIHCSHILLVSLSQLFDMDFSSLPGLVLEWSILVIPTLLSLTLLSNYAVQISWYILALAIVILLTAYLQNKIKPSQNFHASKKSFFVSNHRNLMIIFTTVGILAVDFPVFPRRFAKTESFGYGWMDLGVGTYAFVNGLVSPEARGNLTSLKKNLLGCTPLVVLGLIRFISVTILGYHENVTEYGVHWNFFFSLAAVRLFSSLILTMVSETKSLWVMSIGIGVVYEGFLTFGLAEWILSEAARDNLISANREGIASSLGYLALYLAGVSWGREVFGLKNSLGGMLVMLRLLLLWSGLMWLNLMYSITFFLPPSRRLANYTFITWIIAYNLTVMTIFLLTDLLVLYMNIKTKTKPKNIKGKKQEEPIDIKEVEDSTLYRCPNLVKAVDQNALLFFLVSNLLTGCVNMVVETINTPDTEALTILFIYQAGLALIFTIVYKFGIRIKCW